MFARNDAQLLLVVYLTDHVLLKVLLTTDGRTTAAHVIVLFHVGDGLAHAAILEALLEVLLDLALVHAELHGVTSTRSSVGTGYGRLLSVVPATKITTSSGSHLGLVSASFNVVHVIFCLVGGLVTWRPF